MLHLDHAWGVNVHFNRASTAQAEFDQVGAAFKAARVDFSWQNLFLASCGFYCAYYKCGPVGGCCLSVMDCTSCEDPVLLGEPCHAMAINDNDTIIDYCCFEEKRVPLPLAVALPR